MTSDIFVIDDLEFSISEAEKMCDIVNQSIDQNIALNKESFRNQGRSIDWNYIAATMNLHDAPNKTAAEYQRIWKYIAYGELYDSNTTQYPESDEEMYCCQPYEAICRYEPTSDIVSTTDEKNEPLKEESNVSNPLLKIPRKRLLRRPFSHKHPSKKVKLIVSNSHVEDPKPPINLVFTNEKNLQMVTAESTKPRTNSTGAYDLSVSSMVHLIGNRPKASAPRPPLINVASNDFKSDQTKAIKGKKQSAPTTGTMPIPQATPTSSKSKVDMTNTKLPVQVPVMVPMFPQGIPQGMEIANRSLPRHPPTATVQFLPRPIVAIPQGYVAVSNNMQGQYHVPVHVVARGSNAPQTNHNQY